MPTLGIYFVCFLFALFSTTNQPQPAPELHHGTSVMPRAAPGGAGPRAAGPGRRDTKGVGYRDAEPQEIPIGSGKLLRTGLPAAGRRGASREGGG